MLRKVIIRQRKGAKVKKCFLKHVPNKLTFVSYPKHIAHQPQEGYDISLSFSMSRHVVKWWLRSRKYASVSLIVATHNATSYQFIILSCICLIIFHSAFSFCIGTRLNSNLSQVLSEGKVLPNKSDSIPRPRTRNLWLKI